MQGEVKDTLTLAHMYMIYVPKWKKMLFYSSQFQMQSILSVSIYSNSAEVYLFVNK